MKIIRETDDQLILSNTPWVLSLALVGMILVFSGAAVFRMGEAPVQGALILLGALAFGGVFLIAFVRRTQLILDRMSGQVILRRRGLLGYSEKIYALKDLSSARTQASKSSNGGTTRRAALIFDSGPDQGTHPVTLVYTSGNGPKRAAAAINRWLERQQKS